MFHQNAPAGYWLFKVGSYHVLAHKRGSLAALALTAALILTAGLTLIWDVEGLTLGGVFLTAAGLGDPMHVFLIQELRMPRLIAGLASGFALGIAGCLLQTLARNRLATPGVIGIDDGATAFAVASIVAVPTSLAPSALALSGAAVAAALAFGLSGSAGSRGYRFIVVGIGVGAMFGALTNFMLARAHIDSANLAYPWTVGSLNARPPEAVWILMIGLVVCVPCAKYLARALNVLRFSDAVAQGLGIRLRWVRIHTLIVTVVLTALGVAVVGPVGLIALVAPEIARHLAGHRGVAVMGAGLAGALLMLIADWVGRSLFAPIEIPVGVIMAAVGGPYLLWILLRQPSRRTE